MVARLGERIEDRCGDLEGRIVESEQRAEECLVALEMSRRVNLSARIWRSNSRD
jgi:hypothetical protein